jgi:hypothetical protein
LKTDVFADFASRPSLLRERYLNHHGLLVIDEIQMVPDLLNEIHWIHNSRFDTFFPLQFLQISF